MRAERRLKLSVTGIVARYAGIARERAFVTHALVLSLGFGALFAYLGGSPIVFIEIYHVTPPHYGMLFGMNACGYIVASQFTSRVLKWVGADRLLHVLVRVLLGLMVVLCVDVFTGFGGLPRAGGAVVLHVVVYGSGAAGGDDGGVERGMPRMPRVRRR